MKPYYYVYKHGDQGPRVRHHDLATAQEEAERLAAKSPGQSFEILKCVGYASTSKASTFWMDGEGPPEKPRYRELEEGETIEQSDEWRDEFGNWREHAAGRFNVVGEPLKLGKHYPHRRPL